VLFLFPYIVEDCLLQDPEQGHLEQLQAGLSGVRGWKFCLAEAIVIRERPLEADVCG
jgi:hypothetical protein